MTGSLAIKGNGTYKLLSLWLFYFMNNISCCSALIVGSFSSLVLYESFYVQKYGDCFYHAGESDNDSCLSEVVQKTN